MALGLQVGVSGMLSVDDLCEGRCVDINSTLCPKVTGCIMLLTVVVVLIRTPVTPQYRKTRLNQLIPTPRIFLHATYANHPSSILKSHG